MEFRNPERRLAAILAADVVGYSRLMSEPEAYWALGYVYAFRKQYDEAAAAANQAVTLAPNYADGYGLLAYISNWQGKADDAISHIRKAMALNPHYPYDYPWNLGLAFYSLGRYPEAVEPLHALPIKKTGTN
jgi:tetratricopeptide (TPR) repeat protein